METDILVVGSGFAGSLAAMVARRLGRSVIMVERGRHPRFVIGESSTPMAALLWTELARRYDLTRLAPLAKWGSWRRAYPEIACGLKRGFSFIHHTAHTPFRDGLDHQRQLLVASSSTDETADTHWYRPEFDHFLVTEAQNMGVTYFDQTALSQVSWTGTRIEAVGQRLGSSFSVRARLLIDATGPRGFMHRALRLPTGSLVELPHTEALYSHFRGVRRFGDMGIHEFAGAPYPIDDAALHHVFEGGWIWVLPFNNGITSAGIAVETTLARELRLEDGAPAWERVLARLPSVREQFAAAQSVAPFIHSPHLPFFSPVMSGPRWVMLPYAAGFVDPLLSTGFPLSLFGLLRLAGIMEKDLEGAEFEQGIAGYSASTHAELGAAQRLVGALYATMGDFPMFARITLLYFAAASFSEASWGLGRPQQAGGFLLHDHPGCGRAFAECCRHAVRLYRRGSVSEDEREALTVQILEAIEPVNVAGLGRADRVNWYPIDAADLRSADSKLGVSSREIEALLACAR